MHRWAGVEPAPAGAGAAGAEVVPTVDATDAGGEPR